MRVVLIVHGLNRPFSNNHERAWMEELQAYLRDHGHSQVEIFRWSGSLCSLFSQNPRLSFLKHLASIQNSAREAETVIIDVVAKSYGALLVELALANIDSHLPIGTLVRIGTPDTRATLLLEKAIRVVDIVSDHDALYSVAKYFTTMLFPALRQVRGDRGVTRELITLPGLSHGDLNKNVQVYCAENGASTTYAVYALVLRLASRKEIEIIP